MPKPNDSTTSDAMFDFDLDGYNISEVIMFLQKLARSPDASDMHIALSKHITYALVKIKEEKLKHKASIPRKLEDSWEPIINMQVNDFDLKASCDLGSSVSIMLGRFMKCLIFHHWKIVISMSQLMIMLRRNSWEVLMMGSQLSYTFLGIEDLCFSFSSLIFTRASVTFLVKATCISLASGLLASFCKNIITSEILQPSISKSNLASLVVGIVGVGIGTT